MKLIIAILCYFQLHIAATMKCNLRPENSEERLKKDLFCSDYDPEIRPLNPASGGKTQLKIHMTVLSFQYQDYTNILIMNTETIVRWSDLRLEWHPQEFDGIDGIIISKDEHIWTPNLTHYNSYNGKNECKFRDDVRMKSDGQIQQRAICAYSALCQANFGRWPFDQQNCSIELGSWILFDTYINYDARDSKVVYDSANSYSDRWNLRSASAEKIDIFAHPVFKVSFIIERKYAADAALVFVPILLIFAVNIVAMACLDFVYKERTLILIFNVLSCFTVMQLISWYIPKSGPEVPNIVILMRDSLFLTMILLVEAVCFRKMASSGTIVSPLIEGITQRVITLPIVGGIFKRAAVVRNESVDIELSEIKCRIEEWVQFLHILDRILLGITGVYYIFRVIQFIVVNYMSSYDMK